MPIYHYAHDDEPNGCVPRFEVVQSMSDDALTTCPQCGAPVHRVLTGFSVGRSTRDMLSPSNLASKGFTQYRRSGDGIYEKTAGVGPQTIDRDSL